MTNKKVFCKTLNYNEHGLTLFFAVTGCISISFFVSSVNTPTGILSSMVGLHICAIITEIKTLKLIIEKKKKKHD